MSWFKNRISKYPLLKRYPYLEIIHIPLRKGPWYKDFTILTDDDKTSFTPLLYKAFDCTSFINYISEIMDNLSSVRYLDFYLLGDLNLDHVSHKMSEHTKALQTLLNGYGLTQVIKDISCKTLRTQTIIDVIYVKTGKKLEVDKELRTQAKKAIRIARSNYIQSCLEKNKDNPKKFWEGINSMIKNKSKQTPLVLLDDDKIPVSNDELANHVNDYFSSVGPNLAKEFEDGNRISLDTNPETNRTFYLLPVTKLSLLTEIKKINIYKSSGIDGHNSRLIKDAMQIMLSEFTYLCNISFHTGMIPDAWKIATVINIS